MFRCCLHSGNAVTSLTGMRDHVLKISASVFHMFPFHLTLCVLLYINGMRDHVLKSLPQCFTCFHSI